MYYVGYYIVNSINSFQSSLIYIYFTMLYSIVSAPFNDSLHFNESNNIIEEQMCYVRFDFCPKSVKVPDQIIC